jgi:ERCC4-type nuclease
MDTKGRRSKLKPYVPKEFTRKMPVFPSDFIVVYDTREQRPLFNPPPKGLITVRDTLQVGDYSIRGMEDKITIERKGMSDLMSYIGKDRANTIRKLAQMESYEFKALVVEEQWEDLFLPKMYSKVHPESVRAALISFQVKSGLHIFCHPSKPEVEWWVIDRMVYFFNLKRRVTS